MQTIMRAAIVGSKTFNDYNKLVEFIHETVQKYGLEEISLIVSGGAKGADTLGTQFAKENEIELKVFLPEWKKYGRAAGLRRNVEIIDNCDVCFAFWDGKSHGTKHDIKLCKEKSKRCFVYNYITGESYESK